MTTTAEYRALVNQLCSGAAGTPLEGLAQQIRDDADDLLGTIEAVHLSLSLGVVPVLAAACAPIDLDARPSPTQAARSV